MAKNCLKLFCLILEEIKLKVKVIFFTFRKFYVGKKINYNDISNVSDILRFSVVKKYFISYISKEIGIPDVLAIHIPT